MADRSVSVPMTLSGLERPDGRNRFFFRQILITLVRSATSLHLRLCVARFVSDSWVYQPSTQSCFKHASHQSG